MNTPQVKDDAVAQSGLNDGLGLPDFFGAIFVFLVFIFAAFCISYGLAIMLNLF